MNFNDHVESRRIIVEEDSLFRLFVKCRMEGCSSFVDRDNLKKRYIGALLEVKATCNEHHETTWLSGAMVGEERCKTGVINLLLATFCLTVGLRFKQVQDFFSHMRIAFFSESFYYNLQESVLEKAVWFHWLFMQQKEMEAMKTYEDLARALNRLEACDIIGRLEEQGIFDHNLCIYCMIPYECIYV